jgi:putative phage-type endonuclease
MSNERFLEERASGVGGSDIHHVLTLEPYGCARRLWYEKTGHPPDYHPEEKPIFHRGIQLEPVILDMLRAKYPEPEYKITRNQKMLRAKQARYYILHPDGMLIPKQSGESKAVIETKTAGERAWRRMKKEGIPAAYIVQAQWACLVSRLDRCCFAVLWADGWQFESFMIDRNIAMLQDIAARVDKFWLQVQTRQAPPALEPGDARCQRCVYRTTCQGNALMDRAGRPEDRSDLVQLEDVDRAAAEAVAIAVDRYWQIKELADDAEEMMEDAKQKLKAALGEYSAVDVNGARVYHRVQQSWRVDTNLLKAKYPDIYRAVLRPSISQPLRVYSI